MGYGGKRRGAGRKPKQLHPYPAAQKQKQVQMQLSSAEAKAELMTKFRDPLELLMSWADDERLMMHERMFCAREAAKYLHPTLSAMQVNAFHRHDDASNLTTEELHRELAELDAKKHAIEAAWAQEARMIEGKVVALAAPAPEPDDVPDVPEAAD
jgi:hypothetical protein